MTTQNQTNAPQLASDFLKSVLGDTPNNDSYSFSLGAPELYRLLGVVSRQEAELIDLRDKASPGSGTA